MIFRARKWVKPEYLYPNDSLFFERLLQRLDEVAAFYAIVQLENKKNVTSVNLTEDRKFAPDVKTDIKFNKSKAFQS